MTRVLIAGASVAALVAAAALPVVAGVEASVPNPLLAPWSGPYGGVPPFDKVKVEQFKPALEAAMAEQLGRSTRSRPPRRRRASRTRSPPSSAPDATLDRVSTLYGVYSSTLSTPEFQAVEREMAPRLAAVPGPDQPEREAVQAHRGRLRRPRERRASRPSRSGWPGSTTRTSSAPAPGWTRRAKKRVGRDQRAPGRRSSRASTRTCWPTRTTTCWCSRPRRTWPACRTPCARPPRPPPRRAATRASGRS